MRYILSLLFLLFFCTINAQNDSIINHGQQLINQNKLLEANNFFIDNLSVSDSKVQTFYILIGLAEIHKLKLEYKEAGEYYIKAKQISQELQDPKLEFLYHVKMIEFFRKRTLYSDATKHLDVAEKILKSESIDKKWQAKFYGRKAALFTEYTFNKDSTYIYANKALELSEQIGDKEGVFSASLEISSVYENRFEFDQAISYLEWLIDYAKQNGLIQQQVDAYINYSRVLFKNKEYEKGLKESKEALAFAKTNNLFYGEILFTDNIRNYYETLGDINNAYKYLKIRLKLTDEYYKKEHSKFLFELEEKYKLSEKEHEIAISNLELANKNKALASNTVKLYISISLFFLATLIVVLVLYFLKKERNTSTKLQNLSKENEFLLSEANHRINNNLQLVVILITDQLKKSNELEKIQLQSILTKVEAISTLHKHLYKNEDKNKIDASNYLNDVKASFIDLFEANGIHANFNIDLVNIPADHAMYFGLLLTELCINSIKHAFVDDQNKIIDFQLTLENDQIVFIYKDNGLSESPNIVKPKLIDKLARQLKVDYTISTVKGFLFTFKKKHINE
ncbi:sensor histidine kinase [Bizionia sp. KMM 8389]